MQAGGPKAQDDDPEHDGGARHGKPIPRPFWIISTASAAPTSAESTVLSANSSLRDFGDAAGYSRDWQDGPDFDERQRRRQPPIRDLGGVYRGGQQRYVEQGDRAFLRERESAYRGGMTRGDDADWTPPSYLSHPPAHVEGGQTYPSHLPSAAPDSLSSGSPDSGHLLGAAGLGLIGGIALAGVLAVFVFNSFVDENDPANARTTPKVVERLAAPARRNSAAGAHRRSRRSPAGGCAAAPRAPDQIARTAPARRKRPPASRKRPARNALPARQRRSGPIQLDIKVADAADKDEVADQPEGPSARGQALDRHRCRRRAVAAAARPPERSDRDASQGHERANSSLKSNC